MHSELADDIRTRLHKLADCTHKTKSFYIEEALRLYLETYEQDLLSYAVYQNHLQEGTLKTYPLEKEDVYHGHSKNDI